MRCPGKALRSFIGEPLGRGDSQAALAEAKLCKHIETGLGRAQGKFLKHVLTRRSRVRMRRR